MKNKGFLKLNCSFLRFRIPFYRRISCYLLKGIGLLSGICLPLQGQVVVPIPMVDIPAGCFYMGNEGKGAQEDESPVHFVRISKSFRMSKTEITNAQYEQFRPEHKALRGKNGLSIEDDEAVTQVTYQDALDFCQWLSQQNDKTYRLPTEAEWEYACRAGTYTLYYTGDGLPKEMCRNQVIARDYQKVSLQVGKTLPNAFGLYDMHGNVEEWCMDWYGPYESSEQIDPRGPQKGEFRVTRGGSHHTPVKYLRSANRMAMIPEDKHALTGFRIVQVEEPVPMEETLKSAQPFFRTPIPFVIPPLTKNTVPFYAHNHQPSIVECANGDLLAVWFSADEENGREMVILSSRLRSGCERWEEASLFFKVPDRNMTGTSLFSDHNGTLFHMNGVEAAGDWQNLIMVLRQSADNGYTWSSPRIVASEHTTRHQVISGTIQTPEGWWVQACDAGPGSHDGTAVHVSKDGGKTWTDPWDGKLCSTFNQGGKGNTIAGIHAGIVVLKNGQWMALGRGNSLLNAQGKKRMPMSLSSDHGKSWVYQASEFPPIDGGQRLVLMRLKEGPLLLVSFTDHPQRTPPAERGILFPRPHQESYKGYGLYAALSYDEGKTWPVKKLLTDGQKRFLEGGAWTGSFIMDNTHAEPRGYLAGTQSTDGTIHILSSRLHYRFNLSWLENFF